jgi:hypothetical protein
MSRDGDEERHRHSTEHPDDEAIDHEYSFM